MQNLQLSLTTLLRAGTAYDGGREQKAAESHAQGVQRDYQGAGRICPQER